MRERVLVPLYDVFRKLVFIKVAQLVFLIPALFQVCGEAMAVAGVCACRISYHSQVILVFLASENIIDLYRVRLPTAQESASFPAERMDTFAPWYFLLDD
ncbi:MAG: hypothetical protein EHM28_13955 [Spirochaetaceae bacterium]|nr:MAG: hypothetical protein EHM28_13955 [Spirochaetaceae bacterium]